jgi:hypothetical protein
VLEEGDAPYVAPVANEIRVPELQAPTPEEELYHWYEKDGVPPLSWEVSVTDCPLSMVGLAGVTAPAERAAYTVTVEDAPDVCVSDALSVTRSSKV